MLHQNHEKEEKDKLQIQLKIKYSEQKLWLLIFDMIDVSFNVLENEISHNLCVVDV